jgi:CubicO group peptidase (beta-lactamase class C family)
MQNAKERPMRRANPLSFASLILAFAISIFAGPCQAQQEKKEELPHPRTLQQLQKSIKDVAEKNHVPGAGIALVANGELLWCGGVGRADVAANKEVACDTEFRVGSISKSFVSLARLKLQEEGKINLYARLQDVAPEVPVNNQWESTSPVRIVNLLEHTAGFDDMEFSEVYNRHDVPDYPLLEVAKRFTEPQIVRWPPSTRFSYSNPGFGIAGYLIEKTSGQPYDAYIQQKLLAPLGISVGDFRLSDANRAKLAQGYEGNPPQPVPYKNIYLRPAGDMKASPDELAKLVQFFLRRGMAGEAQLLKPETIARMEYPETVLSAKYGLRQGYGLANYTATEGKVITHGHDGGIDGFISSYRYMPEQNWGYVVLLNSTVSGEALQEMNRLAIDFLSRDFPKPQQTTISVPAGELQKFAGYYAPRAPRNQLLAFLQNLTGGTRIRVVDGKLQRSGLFGKADLLLPVGKNLFRKEEEPEATTAFFPDQAGRMVYVRSGIDGEPYGEKASAEWLYGQLALLAGSLVLMLSSLLYAVVWLLLLLFGRLKGVKHLLVRAVPLLAVLSLLAVLLAFNKGTSEIGEFNFWALAVCVGTVLFALLSLAGLVLAWRVPKEEIARGVRIHSLLVALGCCVITLFFFAWHLIGLRLWAA